MTTILAACATPKESLRTTEGVEQARYETTGNRQNCGSTITWSEIIAEGAAADGWLKTFNDPELEKIIDEALLNNLQLAEATANLDAATKLAVQAGAALVPAVSVGGDARVSMRSDVSANGAGATLNTQWEIDIWSGLASMAAAAGEDYRASAAELKAARQSLVAQTAKAWYLATEANLQLALSQEALEIHEQLVKIVETRVDAGTASPQDLVLAKAELSAAKIRQLKAVGALTQALRSIKIILGRYPSAELAVPRDFLPVPPPIPGTMPSELLERRPDLVAAERRVAAAFQRIEAAKAAKLPSLSLTAAGGRSSSELIDLVGVSSDFFSVGANFIAPLDIGGELEAQVQIETAQQEAALANYGAIALQAFGEVENGLTNEALLQEREAFLATSADDNAKAVAAAKTQYDLGATDFLGVLQMQARELNSRISLVRIRNARLAQRIDLHLALGGDFEVTGSGAAQ